MAETPAGNYFALAQRFLAAAAILARPSAVIFRRFFGAFPFAEAFAGSADFCGALSPFDLAQRARWAAAMRSRASGDIVRLPDFARLDAGAFERAGAGADAVAPRIEASSVSSF